MTINIHQHKILILDFGSQYCQLIGRRVREIGVYCEIMPFDVPIQTIYDFKPDGIILSGGPESLTESHTPRIANEIFSLGCPLLGICYGMQALAHQLGGKVKASLKREYGFAEVHVDNSQGLLAKIKDNVSNQNKPLLNVWMSHGDAVTELPPGFEVIASTENSPYAGIANFQKNFYGLQFHPEVTHTHQGDEILKNFIVHICGCQLTWTPSSIIADSIEHIKKQVGSDRVIVALSGGVDSSVVAALMHGAVGKQLICIFVDTGLLRFKESEEVMRLFTEHLGIEVIKIDAKARFMQILKGVVDPEKKRKLIGNEFVALFEEHAKQFTDVKWLAQGTIYPDVIESAKTVSGKAHVIKSHHNVGGLPEKMHLKLIEPLRELFKDEVRKLGLKLGLTHDLVFRHPFPGPGLAIRIIGEVKPEWIEILQKADYIFIQELKQNGYYEKVSQAFVVFLPLQTVGVKGDARSYEYVVALRAVSTIDFMTAHWSELPYEFLGKVSQRIINEVPGISRVVYDISSKPPATIEWE